MKIENVIKFLEICDKESEVKNLESGISDKQGLIKIVILQRGWVVIGKFNQEGSKCWIENGYVIRKWGTTKGLGELAMNGKQSETILDPIPKTEFHELTIVASILCDQQKWQ